MSVLVCNYPMIDFENMITEYLEKNKGGDFTLADIKGVFYTDGGSRVIKSTNYGGWGVHGYLYVDKPTTSNSGCKKATPTTKGYVTGKIEDHEVKAFVTTYIDYYGQIDKNSSNNIAELMGMLRCLFLIKRIGLKTCIIHADSRYVLDLITRRETYRANGWKTAAGKDLANQELFMSLVEMYEEVLEECDLELHWVKGHSGNFGNEAADDNATKGCYLAANKISNVVIKTDSDIRNDFSLNGDYLNIDTPDNYFGKAIEAPKMLSENSLFFTTNGIDVRTNTTYYQASFGKMMNGKDKAERKMLRGKPFADCCISVIDLKTPDPVINNLINIVAEHFPSTGVIECNLAYQTRQAIYSDLIQGGLNTVSVDVNKGVVELPNKEEIASLANPVRQSFRLISDFNAVKEFLDRVTDSRDNPNALGVDTITDITSYLYEKKESKTKTTVKLIEHDDGAIVIPIEIDTGNDKKTTHIPITIGVDTPSRMSMGRMKTIDPKVSLVTWDTFDRTLRFAVLIETTEGIGVWMGIYSNIHLH